MNKFLSRVTRIASALALVVGLTQGAAAEAVGGATYLVGRDKLATFATGPYAGLANPNFGRLTLLYNHGDHFHGIGAFSLTGPASAPTLLETNGNNRLPEVFSLQPPLPLTPGNGAYAGKLVSLGNEGVEYGDLRMAAFDVLLDDAPGTPEAILANSSNGRWRAALEGTRVGLQLVAATTGLNLGDLTTPSLFSVGSTIEIGSGASLDFTPVFWVDSGAAPGTYSASLRFVDLANTGVPLSLGGVFNVDFVAPVPVPAAVWLMGTALVPLVWRGRRLDRA